MSWKLEGRDIVIDGFEKGISDNPYEGINDMRGMNIISVPGEAGVSYGTDSNTMPSAVISITSADPATDIITFTTSSGSISNGQAFTFSGGSLPTGITAGTTYWAYNTTSTTMIIYPDINIGTPVNITATGTGTGTTTNMGAATVIEKNTNAILDSNGRVWFFSSNNSKYWFLGNSLPTSGGLQCKGQGLQWFGSGSTSSPLQGYLFLFMSSRMSYVSFTLDSIGVGGSPGNTWVNEWDPATGAANPGVNTLNTAAGNATIKHPTLVSSNDGIMYIGDGFYIDSLKKAAGAATFDPTTPASYTWTTRALPIPVNDEITSLAELGTTLLIGGKRNYIYPWDRLSNAYSYPIVIAENNSAQMITVNTNTYIFAGSRGRIYITNGSQAQLYKKLPDHLSGGYDPIYTWGGVSYAKNQIYFGVSVTNNGGGSSTAYSGLWAVDVTTDALRVAIIPITSTATVTAVNALAVSSAGAGVYFTTSSGSTYGAESSTTYSSFVSSYANQIITDMINVGQFLTKRTFENVEYKLAAPLGSGESVQISYRTYLTDSWTVIMTSTTSGVYSDVANMNFENVQWVQFRIQTNGNTNSYCRLREIRIR